MKYAICLFLLCLFETVNGQTAPIPTNITPFFEPAVVLDAHVNSNAEEIIPLVSRDGQSLYFSRFMHEENVAGKLSGHDIWISRKNGEQWEMATNIKGLNTKWSNSVVGFNTDGTSLVLFNELGKDQFGLSVAKGYDSADMGLPAPGQIANPPKMDKVYGLSVGNSGKCLFLALDDHGSQGYDLYLSKRLSQKWTEPIRLPAHINSSKNEHSPFLSADSILYFASDRDGGLGGYDIYASKALSDDFRTWSTPVNLGTSINSPAFDAYFSTDTAGNAFFTSNRAGGLSDIYTSKVSSKQPEKDLKHIPVTLDFEVELIRVKREIMVELDANKRSTAQYVFFDFDSTSITDSASRKLNMFAEIINEDSLVYLELQGHADSIGSKDYNKRLSTERSASVRKYLMTHGIEDINIRVLGFGEGAPIADNATEEGRQRNRRVKLVLVKF